MSLKMYDRRAHHQRSSFRFELQLIAFNHEVVGFNFDRGIGLVVGRPRRGVSVLVGRKDSGNEEMFQQRILRID